MCLLHVCVSGLQISTLCLAGSVCACVRVCVCACNINPTVTTKCCISTERGFRELLMNNIITSCVVCSPLS